MADEGGWSLIESDPGIFSSMLWDLGASTLRCPRETQLRASTGVKGVEVEELTALDPALLAELDPFAFIFLFKWRTAAACVLPPQIPSSRRMSAQHTGTGWTAEGALSNALLRAAGESSALLRQAFLSTLQTITNACATLAILNARALLAASSICRR